MDARHAYHRVHRLERRQRPQRIASDVALHDAVQVLQRRIDAAMRNSRGRRRAACRRRASAPASYRLPECVAPARCSVRRSGSGLRLPSTAMHAAPRSLHQVGLSLFDNDGQALHAGRQTRACAPRQRISHSQLQSRWPRAQLAHMKKAHTRGDDSQLGRSGNQLVRPRLVVPRGPSQPVFALAADAPGAA